MTENSVNSESNSIQDNDAEIDHVTDFISLQVAQSKTNENQNYRRKKTGQVSSRISDEIAKKVSF